MSTPIPQPPAVPLIGNLFDIDPQNGILSLTHLHNKYGPIMKLNILGNERYFVSSQALVNELCDEKRFVKDVSGALENLRPGIGDGLFTAYHGEHNWEVAHRTLVPAFGPIGIKGMFDEMYDIATQLISKWARMGAEEPINVTDDFTRLTLDSIALTAMDKRFNSFYHESMHPFVTAMVDFLVEGGRRTRRTRLQSWFNQAPEREFQANISLMTSICEEVIEHRKNNPTDKKDLLNAMLFGKDPRTGEKLSHEVVIRNMITFLIAGHETTSGMLSFTTYYLLKNPEAWQKAQQEVDSVIGKGQVKYEHLAKLPYLEAVLREALRLRPTAPAFSVKAAPGTQGHVILGGEYTVPADATIVVILPVLHSDPVVYGDDAMAFKPERMLADNFTNLPPNSWKPFGNGSRGCIGRPFAWQEALLTLALILQNFNLRMEDPSYELQIKQTLTLKPDGFKFRAILREGIDAVKLEKRMFAGSVEEEITRQREVVQSGQGGKPMTVLYGGNSGTCEGLAQSLAGTASTRGFTAQVQPLDAAIEKFPTDQPVVIISASYEGLPPDNAAAFVEWLKTTKASTFESSQVAVFGCGHKDWISTYQKIPRYIDEELTSKGARKIIARGECNVAQGTIFDDFDAWSDKLWEVISTGVAATDAAEELDMQITTTARATHLRHSVQNAIVLKNEILTPEGVPEKRHVELRLPTNITYDVGDYLALLPVNPDKTVARVLRRFELPWDAMMTLRKGAHTTIPTEKELPVTIVLGAYVELSGPATKKNIATLIKYGATEDKIAGLSGQSVLAMLEACPEIELPFAAYLSMLPPMRIRQYSISSSPLHDPTTASITFSLVAEGDHLGVATNYLRQLQSGSTVQIAIKKSHPSFHLPHDDSTPIVMLAAGTGLAPFHGFVQERDIKIANGKKLAEAILVIGCRHPEKDKLYAEELARWEKEGAVKIFYAYSRAPELSDDCKYVQDRLWREREYIADVFDRDGRAYICGSNQLGKGIADVVAKIAVERAGRKGKELTHEEGLKWWQSLRNERFAVDVFD